MSFWSKLKGLFGAEDVRAEAAPRTPRELFAEEVERALVAAGTLVVRHEPEDFSIIVKEGEHEGTVFLGNIFAETRDVTPAERSARIAALLSARVGADFDIPWEEARERLVPLLRPSTMFALVEHRPGHKPVLRRSFVPMLIETVAIDAPQSMLHLDLERADTWGVGHAQIFQQAREVLGSVPTEIAPYDPEAPFPLWHVSNDDSYESSRLLLPGWLASFADKVHGRPVAVVPDRAMLLVGGDGDVACLQRLLQTAERQYASSPRSISPAPYTVDDQGQVVPYRTPVGHPLEHDVELAHVKLALAEYEGQTEYLQKKLGEDVFVAKFSAIQADDGAVWSYCVWTRDVPSLLPRTTHVMLLDPNVDEKAKRVTWAEVEARLVEEPGVEPPRYRTNGWPAP